MVATLRVMLDQLVTPTEPDLAVASRELASALVAAAPDGCDVEAILPSGGDASAAAVPGISGLRRLALARRELAMTVQFGVGVGVGGGMVHSPTLLAPLVRHDRVHTNDQTVVTVWDLQPWEVPDELPRAAVSWHRTMLKRAVRFADAVVVPTHAHAEKLASLAPLGDRIRVIAGAAPRGFAVPADEVGRRRTLGLPEGYVLLSGGPMPSDGLEAGLAAVAGVDLPVVVIGVEDGHEQAVADLALAAGIPDSRLHVRGTMDAADRGAVLGAALALVAPSLRTAFPWRVVEALTVGVPVVAADTAVNRDVIHDGGALGDAASLADSIQAALVDTLSSAAATDRMAVLAADRGRAFSWRESADKVWMLHADL